MTEGQQAGGRSYAAIVRPQSSHTEFIRFLLVGVGNTALNFVIYSMCVFSGLSPAWSAAIAFACLIPVYLKAHASFVFNSKLDVQAGLKCGVALIVSMALNVGLVTFFWTHFFADPIPAQALGLAPAIGANYVLLRYFAFPQTPSNLSSWKRAVPQLVIAGLAAIAIYVSAAAILLYTNPLLFADDWRHYNHYFFERDLVGAIFGRENLHLMILPNFIFLSNYTFFDGRMSNLALVTVGLLSTAAALAAFAWLRATWKPDRQLVEVVSAFLVWAAILLFLGAPRTLFWGIGIHNHLVVLGAFGAALFASGLAGSLRKPITFVGFIGFATIASTSFTTGSAVWMLGFLGAVLNRERLSTTLTLLVVGLAGLITTVWPMLDKGDVAGAGLNVASLLLFCASLFGSAWITVGPDLAQGNELLVCAGIGALGILVLFLAAARTLLRSEIREMDRLYCYFVLIGSFVVAASLMIGYGRIELDQGLRESLRPRFHTWSLLGWASVAGVMLGAAYEASHRFRTPWPLATYVVSLLLFILLGNLNVVNSSLRYTYSYWMDTVTQVAVNHTNRPTDRRLWRDREEVWLRVIDHLRSYKRNIYAESWPHRMGRDMSPIRDQLSNRCHSKLEVMPSNRHDEWIVRGWILPQSTYSAPIANVYFLDENGQTIGFSKPIFGSRRSENPRYRDRMIWPARLMDSIGLRSARDLPGVSGHFLGRIIADESSADQVRRQLQFVAETKLGWSCSG